MLRFTFYIAALLVCHQQALANEISVKSFTATDNGVAPVDVHALVEDQRGLIYAADVSGVLEFDGIRWSRIELENNAPAKALALDKNGRIYVGGQGTLGYLVPDLSGKMHFNSLAASVSIEERSALDNIVGVESFGTNVAFVTDHQLLVWNGTAFTTIVTEGPVIGATNRNDELYVVESSRGLTTFDGKGLKIIDGGEFVGSNAFFVDPTGSIIGGSSSEGLVAIDIANGAVTQTGLLKQDRGALFGTQIARVAANVTEVFVGTYGKGLLIFDRPSYKARPLPSKAIKQIGSDIHAVAVDRHAQVWLGTSQGVFVVQGPWGQPVVAGAAVEKTASFVAYLRGCFSMKDQAEIFGGAFFETAGGVQSLAASDLNKPVLNFSQNALRFSYASSELVVADEVQFQTILEGYDPEWTEWSTRTYREFTNLVWKKYAFKVRAKHPDGTISAEVSFEFKMAPPWYETYWFYALQFSILGGLVFFVAYLKAFTRHTTIAEKLNGIVVGTIWSLTFSKVGVSTVISSMSGGAAFFSIIMNGFMGIFLKPLQKRLEAKVVKFEGDLIAYYKPPEPEPAPAVSIESDEDSSNDAPSPAASGGDSEDGGDGSDQKKSAA